MNIFLIGFMGCGKTTLGKQLAREMGYRFVDQDLAIEDNQGMSIANIFSLYGETKFREIEHQTIIDLAKGEKNIVATGGGAPCFYDNMDIMNKGGISVYLKVPAPILFQRLRVANSERPLIKNKSDEELKDFIQSKLIEREVFYSKSTITIQSNDIRVSDVYYAIREYQSRLLSF